MIRNNNQQNGRRRGRGGGGGGQGGGMAPRAGGGQNYGNNRLDIRQRGNATQLLDKYKTLARDAAQQGDRVVAEYYLQYADHYFRVLNEIRERQPEHQRGPRPGYDADDEDGDMNGGYNPGYAGAGNPEPARQDNNAGDAQDGQSRYDTAARDDGNGREDQPRDERTRGYERQDTRGRDDGRRDDNRRDEGRREDSRGDDGRRDEVRADNGRRSDARVDDGRRDETGNDSRRAPARDRGFNGRSDAGRDDDRRDTRRDRGDRNIAHEEVPFADESPISGLPGPATLTTAEVPAVSDEEAPKRRRGRPRKVVDDAPVDPVEA